MPKLLGEFLQEQQEPFALEVYLVERGYCRCKNLNAGHTLCSSANYFTSSASSSIRKRRYVLPNCSDFLKAVFNQFVVANNNPKLKNCGSKCRKNALMQNSKCRQENATEDGFPSPSSTTVFDSVGGAHCPEANTGDLLLEGEVDADRNLKQKAEEDSKQLSPVSVLEETESEEDSPIYYKRCIFKTAQGESSNSISQCKLKKPTHYNSHQVQELAGSKSRDQYIINKNALQVRKQLLIDCVQEVIEKKRKADKREELEKMWGAQELWKLVCENVWIWSQDTINEGNIDNLLHFDFLASADEWNADSEQQKIQIAMEVENAILEDVINGILT